MFLGLFAAALDDIERTRIANQNRLRQMLRGAPPEASDYERVFGETETTPKDDQERGFGLTLAHPSVATLHATVTALLCNPNGPKGNGCCLEHDAIKNLTRTLRSHPLAPWVTSTRGVGEKQAARLLAAISDPYLHPATYNEDGSLRHPEGPRTVSQLWAYAGLHTVDGEAARRRRGEQSMWSTTAKMRAVLVAESCKKGLRRPCTADETVGYAVHVDDCGCFPLRVVYDRRKAATEGRAHASPCPRCGPSGKPAPAGTPWSRAHRDADATRIVAKELLKQLWRAARAAHERTT